mgnify:FL=1
MISGFGAGLLTQGKKGAFYNTLEEFHKYWSRIDIICPQINRGLTRGKFETEPLFGNVFIHPSPWSLWRQPLWILKKGCELYREQKFDVITVQEYPPFYNGIGARFLWNKIKIPYVLEIHHIPGYPKAANLKEWFYKIAMRYFVKYDAIKAKAVRVVNQHQVLGFLIKAGVPVDKIKYIPSAYIDLETFWPMPDVQKKYDFVFAGRLEKNKNIGSLIEAIKIVKKSKPDVSLLIIGSGPELNDIRLQITDYKLQNNVFLSGWLPTANDVAVAYNSAKIFINSSLNEGGPRVVLEAMACGLPVVTTSVGLMPDLIKNGDNGFLCDWGPDSMADRMAHLLNNENLQKKFSFAGLELVKQFEKKTTIKNLAENQQKLI